MNSFFITCKERYQTPMYSWLPATEPTCVIHIAHGMAEYAARYAQIAENLVQQGIAVYANDQRYHGKSAQAENRLGIAEKDWFIKQVEDYTFIIAHLRQLHPGKKIFFMGHSMGSFLAQRFFQLHGNLIDGLILSATNGKKDPLMPFGIFIAGLQLRLFGKYHRSKLINTLSFGKFNNAFKPNRTDFDWLSKDNAEVDKYVADQLCGFVCSSTFFHYFFKGIADAFSKKNISIIPTNIPVYAFAGDQDPVGLNGKGFMQLINNWKVAGVKDLTHKLYPGGRHEMLNEINRKEVVEDLCNWIVASNFE